MLAIPVDHWGVLNHVFLECETWAGFLWKGNNSETKEEKETKLFGKPFFCGCSMKVTPIDAVKERNKFGNHFLIIL